MAHEDIVRAILIVAAHASLCCGLKEAFSHNIQLNKKYFGQLKLESRGHFADIIHLDTAEGIKVNINNTYSTLFRMFIRFLNTL